MIVAAKLPPGLPLPEEKIPENSPSRELPLLSWMPVGAGGDRQRVGTSPDLLAPPDREDHGLGRGGVGGRHGGDARDQVPGVALVLLERVVEQVPEGGLVQAREVVLERDGDLRVGPVEHDVADPGSRGVDLERLRPRLDGRRSRLAEVVGGHRRDDVATVREGMAVAFHEPLGPATVWAIWTMLPEGICSAKS